MAVRPAIRQRYTGRTATVPVGAHVVYTPTIFSAVRQGVGGTAATVAAPESITVDRLASNRIRVNFSQPVTLEPGLLYAQNYSITPAVEVLSVVAQAGPTPTWVELTIGNQGQGVTHTLKVNRMRFASDSELIATFVGVGVAPKIKRVAARGSSAIVIDFDVDPGMALPAVGTAASYFVYALGFSVERTIVAALVDDPARIRRVLLQLDGPMSPGVDGYEIAPDTLYDTAGNQLEPPYFWRITAPAGTTIDHVAEAIERLPQQFRDKPKLEGWLAALVRPYQALELAAADVLGYRSIFSAYGQTLDNIGSNMGLPREDASDAVYRRRFVANGMRVAGRSTGPEIIAILQLLDNGFAPNALSYAPHFPACFVCTGLQPQGSAGLLAGHWTGRFLHRVAAQSVRSIYEFEESGADLLVLEEETAPGMGGTLEEESAPGVGSKAGEAV